MANKETIIISLGGSLVVPENVDIDFLKYFKKIILKNFKKFNFVIVVGGGKTARNYLNALKEFGANSKNRDLMGISITKINAELVKNIFAKNIQKKIIFGGGTKPGWSTDYVSVLMAKKHKTKTIINLSNIDYVYEKNPKKFPDAKCFENISWKDFRKIIGTKWTPGLNVPFDPIASTIAEKQKMKVVVINGKKIKELEKFLINTPFIGTTIQ